VGSNARWDSEIACVATNHLTSPVEEDGTCRYDGELIPMSMVRFHLTADVSSDSPAAVRPVLEGLADATITESPAGFHVEGWAEGPAARELNRELLSALRRVERRGRLRAEWTGGGMVHRFFDYALKGSGPVPPDGQSSRNRHRYAWSGVSAR